MAKILIVEDEKPINDLISMNLKLVGYEYSKVFNGLDALNLIEDESFDLILLDVMLPQLDGFEIAKKINNIPIIFITAKDELHDKITGFELGADDYIVKPFEMIELLARINVVLKRNNRLDETLFIDNIEIKFYERRILKNGIDIELTSKEFELLETLIKNKNIALSREKLLETVWGFDFYGDTRTVDVHILKLRKKLGFENRIKTIFKHGYRLEI